MLQSEFMAGQYVQPHPTDNIITTLKHTRAKAERLYFNQNMLLTFSSRDLLQNLKN